MSQRDLVAELRAARIEAPSEVRARVRLIAAADTTPVRRRAFTWRRALVVALPVAAAVAARSSSRGRPIAHRQQCPSSGPASQPLGAFGRPAEVVLDSGHPAPGAVGDARATLRRLPRRCASRRRAVSRPASSARSRSPSRSAATPARSTRPPPAQAGSADLALKIPRTHIQEAIARLSAIGTITAEQVDVQDLQTGLNATDRTIARLQSQLADLRSRASVHAHERAHRRSRRFRSSASSVARPPRFGRPATPRSGCISAPPPRRRRKAHHGPLHGLGVAFRWLGIGAVYTLALGAPLLLVVLARVDRDADDPQAPRGRSAQPFLIWAKIRNVGSPTGSSSNSGLMQPSSSSSRDS